MESLKEETLCFVTWNICGRKKISPLVDWLSKNLGAEIVFLQETKIGPKDKTEKLDGWQCFFTVHDSNSKGVAILIKDGVSFQYICHDEDYSGQYLVLFCRLHGELFTLVNVYKHKDDKDVLNTLADYLRETAEGVLVVGGDFNTVLDLSFDRNCIAKNLKHTPSMNTFKKFTVSLNLMDSWAYFHPRVKKFTYSQNKSQSRLDLFLLCEEDLERINYVHIYEAEISVATPSKKKTTSDHSPLLIYLKIKELSSHEVPNVASWSGDVRFCEEPDRRDGKINGAEILRVIKSLTDSGIQRLDTISIQTYKKYCCPLTEVLKIYFNYWMKHQQLPQNFNSVFSESDGRKHFNVDYLIFTTILAKRLNILLKTSSEKQSQANRAKRHGYCVTFALKPQEIKWTFLTRSLSSHLKSYIKSQQKLKKVIKSAKKSNEKSKKKSPKINISLLKDLVHSDADSTKENSILKIILPKASNPSDDFRELQDGCPLTRSILSLVLKYLESKIRRKGYIVNVCHFRQAVVIQEYSLSLRKELNRQCKRFKRDSGIELKIFKIILKSEV